MTVIIFYDNRNKVIKNVRKFEMRDNMLIIFYENRKEYSSYPMSIVESFKVLS